MAIATATSIPTAPVEPAIRQSFFVSGSIVGRSAITFRLANQGPPAVTRWPSKCRSVGSAAPARKPFTRASEHARRAAGGVVFPGRRGAQRIGGRLDGAASVVEPAQRSALREAEGYVHPTRTASQVEAGIRRRGNRLAL